jgi:hypothetical protein
VPHEIGKNNTRLEAGFFHFGAATLCRSLQHWVTLGRLGSNWVDIGGRAGVGDKIARIAMTAKIAGIEKQGLAADYADGRRFKRS